MILIINFLVLVGSPSGAAAAAAAILQLSAANRANAPQSKYAELLAVIEDMGRDIRPTYSGSRTATERLKRGEGWETGSLVISTNKGEVVCPFPCDSNH